MTWPKRLVFPFSLIPSIIYYFLFVAQFESLLTTLESKNHINTFVTNRTQNIIKNNVKWIDDRRGEIEKWLVSAVESSSSFAVTHIPVSWIYACIFFAITIFYN